MSIGYKVIITDDDGVECISQGTLSETSLKAVEYEEGSGHHLSMQDRLRLKAAILITQLEYHRDNHESSQCARHAAIAITEVETAAWRGIRASTYDG